VLSKRVGSIDSGHRCQHRRDPRVPVTSPPGAP
jgi:hypothetical protein